MSGDWTEIRIVLGRLVAGRGEALSGQMEVEDRARFRLVLDAVEPESVGGFEVTTEESDDKKHWRRSTRTHVDAGTRTVADLRAGAPWFRVRVRAGSLGV